MTKEIKKQEGTICQAFNSSPVTYKGFHFKIEEKKKRFNVVVVYSGVQMH